MSDSASGCCRICGLPTRPVLDLGEMPPANWLTETRAVALEQFPLLLETCDCGNFQLRHCVDADVLYRRYNYFTPQSSSLDEHYRVLLQRLREGGYVAADTSALEIGSNVGRFLEVLRPHVRSIVGVDPAQNVAEAATAAGVPTFPEFFNAEFARDFRRRQGEVDLVVARHCMAHNCDPYEMLDGIVEVLAPDGTLVIENAYAIATLERNEFDQVYHEHMFYFTVLALQALLERRGMTLREVMRSDVHGGSIVCFAKRGGETTSDIRSVLDGERRVLDGGLAERFATSTAKIRRDLHATIVKLVARGESVYAYGASAKGATLMNACGLTYRDIPYCADSTPGKVGRFMPKCAVEIVTEEWAFANPPNAFLLTAWNYRDELIAKVRSAGLPGVRFIVPIPTVTVL